MALERRVAAWARAHPDLAELGAGGLAMLLVVAVSLTQWGLDDTGLLRGLLPGLLLGVAVAWAYRSRRRREERRERDAQQQRLQLARELHDAVAGQVAIIGVQAAGAQRVIATRPDEVEAALKTIQLASRTAVADLQRMLATLRGDSPAQRAPEPGMAELEGFVALARGAGQPIELHVDGSPTTVAEPSLDHAAYRIAVEGVTNAIKHAPGAPTDVRVEYSPSAVRLSVINARPQAGPAPVPAQRTSQGLGIVGASERAAMFGGQVSAGPTTEGGWALRAALPRQAMTAGEPL